MLSRHSPEYDSSEEEEEEELVYTSGSEDGSEEIEGDGHNQSRDRSAANSSFDAGEFTPQARETTQVETSYAARSLSAEL